MINLMIVAGILIVIMLVFMFILFKNIIKRMNENAKKYFVNKMKDYDYILEEKQDKLEEIKQEVQELKEERRNILNLEKNTEKIVEIEKEKRVYTATDDEDRAIKKVQERIKYNLNVPEYRETNFFNNYKEVRKAFTINNETIIKEFVAEHKSLKEEKQYKALKKIRNKFDEESIYGCLTLNKEEQIKVLKETLTETEKKLIEFDSLVEEKDFTIKKLIEILEIKIEQVEPTIYIYTNVLDDRYSSIDKNIVIKQYNNMSEGIIIKYRNRIYDYSI